MYGVSQRAAQFAGGLLPGPRRDLRFDRGGVLIREDSQVGGDDLGAFAVDDPVGQQGGGLGQAGEVAGQTGKVGGGTVPCVSGTVELG